MNWTLGIVFLVVLYMTVTVTPYPYIIPETSKGDVLHESGNITTYDSTGSPIGFSMHYIPQRVVTNQEGVLETIIALGAADSVVAASVSNRFMRSIASSELGESKKFEIIRHEFDRESILILNPDFIIGWKSTFSRNALHDTSFWNRRGTATYITATSNQVKNYASIYDECKFIEDMGCIFGKEQKSRYYINRIYEAIAYGMGRRNKSKCPPRVMVLQYNNPRYIFSYEDSWLVGDMVKRLGGILLFGVNHTVSKEEIIRQNPDIIFVLCSDESDQEYYESLVLDDVVLNGVAAVKDHKVYGIPFTYVYSPGIRLADGLIYMADRMYP